MKFIVALRFSATYRWQKSKFSVTLYYEFILMSSVHLIATCKCCHIVIHAANQPEQITESFSLNFIKTKTLSAACFFIKQSPNLSCDCNF